MMHMSFWWGDELGDFFFKGFTINTSSSMFLLCLALFVLSILVEGLKVHKTQSRAKAAREKSRSLSCSPSENATLLSTEAASPMFKVPVLSEVIDAFKEISFFFFHNVLNYGLMLAVMMFNGFIFIAVVAGAFVGYLLFGHLSMKTNMENLQAIQTKIICSSRCADSEEPCTSGTTPIVSHCPTIVGEGSRSGVNVLRAMNKSNISGESTSSESLNRVEVHHQPCN